jgi:hypothetical protein
MHAMKPTRLTRADTAIWQVLLVPRQLKQLHQVPGRIAEKALRATGSGQDVIAELHARGTQSCGLARKVIHDNMDAVPATCFGASAIRYGRPAELVGPSNSRSDPSVTSANTGAAFERALKPRCFVYHEIAASTSWTM